MSFSSNNSYYLFFKDVLFSEFIIFDYFSFEITYLLLFFSLFIFLLMKYLSSLDLDFFHKTLFKR